MSSTHRIPDSASLPELTIRGVILGALITVVFTAANVYLGLKIGLTFSSAIPAAVISMTVLRVARDANILENNMVQTQASAAGTLSSIIFILPGLVMVGHWQGFPYWQTFAICCAGGMLGVMYTIPLRHAMVVDSTLPYPEGVAAAEILSLGNDRTGASQAASGVADLLSGGVVSAAVALATSGLRILGDSISVCTTAAGVVLQFSSGFSLAMLGAGYLVGIVAGVAILIGLLIAWGIAVPVLTAMHPLPAGLSPSDYATSLWSKDVRFIGAGTIGVAAIWTLITLLKPMIEGVKTSFRVLGHPSHRLAIPRTERDVPPHWIIGISLALVAILVLTFASFLSAAPISARLSWSLTGFSVLFAVVFGFMIAAACGYMAGLIGSSASPISGIGIVAVILVSLLILGLGSLDGLLTTQGGTRLAVALAIFTTSAIIAIATISNDNLQDLKTGWLLGSTPWRQQLALLIGCLAGAMVIPPILDLLYNAYGFAGAMPRPGMDPGQAMNAPQATLLTAIATGIFTHQLNWSMVLIGASLGTVLVGLDETLRHRGGSARLPVLATGIGIYLPPTVATTLVAGTLLAWLIEHTVKRRAARQGMPFEKIGEQIKRRGVLLASGLIVGESLIGVIMAAIIGLTGNETPLSIVGPGYATIAPWLGLLVFLVAMAAIARRIMSGATISPPA